MVAAWAIQIGILNTGLWHYLMTGFKTKNFPSLWKAITLDATMVTYGEYAAATVLVTSGAILGKCNLN